MLNMNPDPEQGSALAPGEAVEIVWRGDDKFYPAVISAIRSGVDGLPTKFDVHYGEINEDEFNVERGRIRRSQQRPTT